MVKRIIDKLKRWSKPIVFDPYQGDIEDHRDINKDKSWCFEGWGGFEKDYGFLDEFNMQSKGWGGVHV